MAAVQELSVSRFLLDIIPVASASVSEEEIVGTFTKSVAQIFGVDKAEIDEAKQRAGTENALYGYILNTKKAYIDNQLSEYSAFPELIEFRNSGYHSCAVLPLIGDGKVFSFLRLLSVRENKFSDELVNSVAFGASFVSFVLMYKSEMARNLRLAGYFDAAFNSQTPQFIVNDSGTVIKVNKAAMRVFGAGGPGVRKISEFIPLDYSGLSSLTEGAGTNVALNTNSGRRLYAVGAGRINERLIHVAADDITDRSGWGTLNEILAKDIDTCLVTTDSEFMIANLSQNADKLLGYSKGVMQNGNFVDLVTRNEQNQFRSAVVAAGQRQGTSLGSVTIEISGIGRRYFHYNARRYMDGYMILLTRAEMEKAVQDTRADLEEFMNTSSDMVFGVDGLGYIRSCNLAAENITGLRKDELIGREIKSMYSNQDQSVLDRDINYVRNGSKVDYSSVTLVDKKGEPAIPATHSIRMVSGGADESGVAYLIVVKELATKRRIAEMEQDMRKMEGSIKIMEQQAQLKSQFIYNISHELKTPLTNIMGYSKLLLNGDYGPLNDDQRSYIDTIQSEANRFLLMIQQVLDAAKLESKKVKLEFKDVDLRNLANNPSIKSLEDSALSKGLTFEWKVDFDVPEKISADPNRLIQIFVNLIGNATKFTEKGGIVVHISLQSKKKVRCEVLDTGIGIVDSDKRNLFKKKFYEAQKKGLVQQPGAGTGLGLSITKDLVTLHGGKIGCESMIGKGSTFWFILPTAQRPKKKEATDERKTAADDAAQEPEADSVSKSV